MRRKLLMLILLIASAPTLLQARLPSSWFFDRFRLGVEWGYTQCFFLARNYNFFSEEGYRIHEQFSGMHLASNGSIYGQIGYDLHKKVNLALYVGYIGVGKDNRLLPVQLRASFFPRTTTADGLFTFAQGGPAWHTIAGGFNLGWLAGLGGGWRLLCRGRSGRKALHHRDPLQLLFSFDLRIHHRDLRDGLRLRLHGDARVQRSV